MITMTDIRGLLNFFKKTIKISFYFDKLLWSQTDIRLNKTVLVYCYPYIYGFITYFINTAYYYHSHA